MESKPSSHRLAEYFLCITSSLPAEKSADTSDRLALEIAYRYPSNDYFDTRIQWATVHLVSFDLFRGVTQNYG